MNTPEAVDFDAYGRRISIYVLAAGEGIEPHKHPWSHKIFVVFGEVEISKELHCRRVVGPCELTIDAGLDHGLVAISAATVVSAFPQQLD